MSLMNLIPKIEVKYDKSIKNIEPLVSTNTYLNGARILTTKSSWEEFICVQVTQQTKRITSHIKEALKIIPLLDCEFLMIPIDYCISGEAMCGSSSSMVFPNYKYNADEEIRNRAISNNWFAQREMLYLIFGVAKAVMQFHTQGTKIGDIRPQNILINEDGQFKLVNKFCFQSEHINYFKSLHSNCKTYLEEMIHLENKVQYPKIDVTKAECFSVGLTLFEIATLFDCSVLYDFKQCTFNMTLLRQKIQLFQSSQDQNYVSEIKNIIIGLLEVDPQLRWPMQDIYFKLKPHQYNITQFLQVVFQRESQVFVFNKSQRKSLESNYNSNANINPNSSSYINPNPNIDPNINTNLSPNTNTNLNPEHIYVSNSNINPKPNIDFDLGKRDKQQKYKEEVILINQDPVSQLNEDKDIQQSRKDKLFSEIDRLLEQSRRLYP